MFLPVDDALIFTTSFGSPQAPALVGIGGWIGSWEMWQEPFSALSASWYTVAYDHRGSGATIAPPDSISIDRLVKDFFAVMDACRIERCVLAAESAGALTALSAALQAPQRVAGLVLVGGLSYSEPVSEDTPFVQGLRRAYRATLDRFVDLCVPEADSAPVRRWGQQILNRAAPEAAVALLRAAGQVDLREQYPRIQQPVLLLHGELDAIVPLEQAQWLAKTLPNATLKVIPGAGHVPTMTRPAEIVSAIQTFFESHSFGA